MLFCFCERVPKTQKSLPHFRNGFGSRRGLVHSGFAGPTTSAPAILPRHKPPPPQRSPPPPSPVQPVPLRDAAPSVGLNIVILDPAHGGVDLGARGTEGIRESEVVLQFAAQVRRALEAQGFQVIQTREGNENPSFDDRSAQVDASAAFSLSPCAPSPPPASPVPCRCVMPESPVVRSPSRFDPWDQSASAFPNAVSATSSAGHGAGGLARRFKGSPDAVRLAPIRQLRATTRSCDCRRRFPASPWKSRGLGCMIPGISRRRIPRGVARFAPLTLSSHAGSPHRSAAMNPKWRLWLAGGLLIAVIAAAFYFPALRRQVYKAKNVAEKTTEQARRELLPPAPVTSGEPRVQAKMFWGSRQSDGTLVPVILDLPLSDDPTLRAKEILNTLLAGPVDPEARALPPDAPRCSASIFLPTALPSPTSPKRWPTPCPPASKARRTGPSTSMHARPRSQTCLRSNA